MKERIKIQKHKNYSGWVTVHVLTSIMQRKLVTDNK